MKNVVLARIDDRLLHGQVVVSWIPYTKTNEIIIVDDEYATDEFLARIIKEAAPDFIEVNVMTVDETAQYINSHDEGNNLMLLSRNVESISKLINLNVKLNKINLGA